MRADTARMALLTVVVLSAVRGGFAQDAEWAAARQYERQEQWAQAAAHWAAFIAVSSPTGIPTQDAACRAAMSLERLGRFAEAVAFYDTAIAIGNARSDTGARGVLIKRFKRDAMLRKADALTRAGNHEAAAAAYEAATAHILAELLGESQAEHINQDNAANLVVCATEAARSLETRGQRQQALTIYELIITIADRRAHTADGENVHMLNSRKREALLGKALVCQREGCLDDARQTFQRLRLEFPDAPLSLEAALFEADLYGQSADAAAAQNAREQQATALLNQAAQAGDIESQLAVADQVIVQFQDTTAALSALDFKARLLTDAKRFDEAHVALTALLDTLRLGWSGSELFQSTRVRLKHLLADWIDADLKAYRQTPTERWEALRSICVEITVQDTTPDEAAQAQMTLAESYAWERRYAESGEVAKRFLADYNPEHFHGQTTSAHLYAALAEQHAGRYDAAYPHLRWIIDFGKLDTSTPFGRQRLRMAYWCIWRGLKLSGAPDARVTEILEEYATKFPEYTANTANWRLPKGMR